MSGTHPPAMTHSNPIPIPFHGPKLVELVWSAEPSACGGNAVGGCSHLLLGTHVYSSGGCFGVCACFSRSRVHFEGVKGHSCQFWGSLCPFGDQPRLFCASLPLIWGVSVLGVLVSDVGAFRSFLGGCSCLFWGHFSIWGMLLGFVLVGIFLIAFACLRIFASILEYSSLFSGNPCLFRAVPVTFGVNFCPFWCIHPHFDAVCCIPSTLHHCPNPSGTSLQFGIPFHTFGILFMTLRSHFLYLFGSFFHIFGSLFNICCPFSYIFGPLFP